MIGNYIHDYLLVTARKGISSMQLSKEIGITQKSAWFVLHRIREACGSDLKHLLTYPQWEATMNRAWEVLRSAIDEQTS